MEMALEIEAQEKQDNEKEFVHNLIKNNMNTLEKINRVKENLAIYIMEDIGELYAEMVGDHEYRKETLSAEDLFENIITLINNKYLSKN